MSPVLRACANLEFLLGIVSPSAVWEKSRAGHPCRLEIGGNGSRPDKTFDARASAAFLPRVAPRDCRQALPMPTIDESLQELARATSATQDSINSPAERLKEIQATMNELLIATVVSQASLSSGSNAAGPRLGKPAQRPPCGPRRG